MAVLHEGHRKHVRARYAAEGLTGFADHEILELLLFYAIPQRNTNDIAHELINTFGSLHSVLEASPEQLQSVSGIGENAATLLSLLPPLLRRYQASLMGDRVQLNNRDQAKRYCQGLVIGLRTEHFYIVCLDASMRVLGHALIAKGSLGQVSAYPRLIVAAALQQNAASIILCHNHLGGSAAPSQQDLDATHRIIRVMNDIDILVLDHMIVSDTDVYSMAQGGDLTPASSAPQDMAADSSGRVLPLRPRKTAKGKTNHT